jgi:mannose-6-phosphate isomerase-like protein (cupin superfamily)
MTSAIAVPASHRDSNSSSCSGASRPRQAYSGLPSDATESRPVSKYAHVNLHDLEDSVGERVPGLEGRFARKHLQSRDLGISHFRYAPNLRSPMAHSHREQEEAYVVVSGSGRVLLDDELVELAQWDVLRLAPEVVRAFEAGPDGLELIAIGGPKPEDGDGVMAAADWPDSPGA